MWYLLHPRLTKGQCLRLAAGVTALAVCLCISLLGGGVWARLYRAAGISPQPPGAAIQSSRAKVHFIDVGQGDAVLLEQGGHFALIDAGPQTAAEEVLRYLELAGVTRLELLVMTHPDGDHIGGMCAVLNRLPVEQFWLPYFTPEQAGGDTLLYQVLYTAAQREIPTGHPPEQLTFALGEGTVTLLSDGVSGETVNDASLCTRFAVDDAAFLNTGDAELAGETKLLHHPERLSAVLLKAGHHGSATSTDAAFLAAVQPRVAVISCGWNNGFGHPAPAVTERLAQCGAQLYRTDQQGSVVAILMQDGTVTVETEF